MKKILTVSIVAVMAVTAANAEIASKAYVDQKNTAMDTRMTAAEGSITTLNANESTEGSVAYKIAQALENVNASEALQSVTANDAAGVVTNIAKNGTAVTMTKAKVTGSDIADNAAIAKTQLATDVQTSLGKADTALQEAAITDMLTKTEASTTYATQTAMTEGLATKQNTITAQAPLSHELVSGLGALATKGTVANADIAADAAIAKSKLATDVQISLGKADTALQEAAITDMLTKTEASTTYATQTAMTEGLATKQDTLTEAQLAAANSGITAAKVTTYEGYATTIAGKQDTLTAEQLAAANSGITEAKVTAYDALVTAEENYGDIVTHSANEFASAAQGAKADSAVQTVSSTGTGNVVTAVSANANGTVTVSTGNAIMSGIQPLSANEGDGVYALTMSKSGDVETYKWEMIQRAE